jgi:hypothetical protein
MSPWDHRCGPPLSIALLASPPVHDFHVGNPDEPKWLHVLVSEDVSIVDRPSQMQKHLAVHYFPHLLAPRDSLYFSVFSPSNRQSAEPFALIGSDVRRAPNPRNRRDWRRNAEGGEFKHSGNDYTEGVGGSDILYLESRIPSNIRNWEVGWNRVDGQMGAILGFHYIDLPKRSLSGSLAHVSGLLRGDSLPSDYKSGADNSPSGDSFGPCYEYVPPWRVGLALICILYGFYCAREGSLARGWLACLYAIYVIAMAGCVVVFVKSGHKNNCGDQSGSTKQSQYFNHNTLVAPANWSLDKFATYGASGPDVFVPISGNEAPKQTSCMSLPHIVFVPYTERQPNLLRGKGGEELSRRGIDRVFKHFPGFSRQQKKSSHIAGSRQAICSGRLAVDYVPDVFSHYRHSLADQQFRAEYQDSVSWSSSPVFKDKRNGYMRTVSVKNKWPIDLHFDHIDPWSMGASEFVPDFRELGGGDSGKNDSEYRDPDRGVGGSRGRLICGCLAFLLGGVFMHLAYYVGDASAHWWGSRLLYIALLILSIFCIWQGVPLILA